MKQDIKQFFPYIIPIAFSLLFPLGFVLALMLGYINISLMFALPTVCALLLVRDQWLMDDKHQSSKKRLRFFPYIIPIAFPLIFPLSFGISIALVHMLPPALGPALAVLLVASFALILGLQFLAIMWTIALWIWVMIKAIGKSIIKMGNWLLERLTSQPKQPYDPPWPEVQQEQSQYRPMEQIQ
jgi:hypothetical protein